MRLNCSKISSAIKQDPARFRTLKDVAACFGASSETVRREFFRTMRIHVHEFIVTAKVEKMKELLLDTKRRCFEICFDVGFRREDTGAKVFKRFTGMSMEEYRKQNGNATYKANR